MRHNIQKYLQDAQHGANQRYMGADGFLDGHRGFTNDLAPGEFYPADGAAPAAQQTALSQPYIVQVSNASAASVANFDIWWAANYLGSTFSAGSLTISGVTLSAAMNNTGITYYNMLQQSLTNNFTVGKTYLTMITGSNAQITQPISIYTQDINGNTAGKLLPTPLSPFQFQSSAIENNFAYRIDSNTAVRMTILASVVFQIYFYPSFTLNMARALGDNAIGRSFAPPQITPVQAVKQIG